MSDYYLALVDPVADATNANERCNKLRDGLIIEGIVSPEMADKCVYGNVGYLPGPRLRDLYDFADGRPDRAPELRYWDALELCGVEFHSGKWVNLFGFTVFDSAKCPSCKKTFDNCNEIMTPLGDAIDHFLNRDDPPMLACPACKTVQDVRSWITTPHMGFCHVAAQFWNWPSFDSKGWRVSIPEIASSILGTSVMTTYGRM